MTFTCEALILYEDDVRASELRRRGAEDWSERLQSLLDEAGVGEDAIFNFFVPVSLYTRDRPTLLTKRVIIPPIPATNKRCTEEAAIDLAGRRRTDGNGQKRCGAQVITYVYKLSSRVTTIRQALSLLPYLKRGSKHPRQPHKTIILQGCWFASVALGRNPLYCVSSDTRVGLTWRHEACAPLP